MSSPRGLVAGGIGARGAARREGDIGKGGEGQRVAGGSGVVEDWEDTNLIGLRYDLRGWGRTLKYILRFLSERLA